jgi:hypothetical protein
MNINQILDRMTPKTLAELSVLVSKVIGENEDFEQIHKLSNLIFDAGVRNCGDEFTEDYFEAIIKYESVTT